MLRLENCYASKHRLDLFYNKDRGDLIWREVQQLSDEWMVRTVDLFIGEYERPPLMPQFREQISKERERLWVIEKKANLPAMDDNLSPHLCTECMNSGRAWVDGSVFLCYCEYGAKRPENFPRLARNNLKLMK